MISLKPFGRLATILALGVLATAVDGGSRAMASRHLANSSTGPTSSISSMPIPMPPKADG